MIRLALLRHFPTDWNAEGRLQGRTDIPLSAEGREEMAGLRLPDPFRALPVVASPLSRARETAEAMAEGRAVRLDARLAEMSFGDWEGRIGEELEADPACPFRPLEDWGWDFTPPAGESPADLAARLRPALAEIAAAGPHLVVCHRGVIRCLLALASGWAYRGPMPFRIRPASIHVITVAPDGTPTGWEEPVKLVPR